MFVFWQRVCVAIHRRIEEIFHKLFCFCFLLKKMSLCLFSCVLFDRYRFVFVHFAVIWKEKKPKLFCILIFFFLFSFFSFSFRGILFVGCFWRICILFCAVWGLEMSLNMVKALVVRFHPFAPNNGTVRWKFRRKTAHGFPMRLSAAFCVSLLIMIIFLSPY